MILRRSARAHEYYNDCDRQCIPTSCLFIFTIYSLRCFVFFFCLLSSTFIFIFFGKTRASAGIYAHKCARLHRRVQIRDAARGSRAALPFVSVPASIYNTRQLYMDDAAASLKTEMNTSDAVGFRPGARQRLQQFSMNGLYFFPPSWSSVTYLAEFKIVFFFRAMFRSA